MPDWFWYFIAWVPYTAILLFYGLGSPWWRSPIGRSLFLSKLSLFLLLSFVLSVFVFGEYAWRDGLRVVLLSGLASAAAYQFLTFVREKRDTRRSGPCPRRRSTDL